MSQSTNDETIQLLSFDEAIKDAGESKKHLLLGNGFSIAFDYNIFNYKSLFETATFSDIEHTKEIFEKIEEYDFEKVIKMLEDTAMILEVYNNDSSLASQCEQLRKDAKKLQELLVETISSNHPEKAKNLEDKPACSCIEFFKNFILAPNQGKIFTLNYDLLLYWTLMRCYTIQNNNKDNKSTEYKQIIFKDGFRDDPLDKSRLHWAAHEIDTQWNIHYLHGAIHLYNDNTAICKHTWSKTEELLIDQIKSGIASNKYPLFVAEGTSEKKKEKIFSNDYLRSCYKKFKETMSKENDALFIYGHSLAGNDKHFLNLISNGKISKVYVSIYGDISDDRNKEIIKNAKEIEASRDDKNPLKIKFFDAKSAKIWDK